MGSIFCMPNLYNFYKKLRKFVPGWSVCLTVLLVLSGCNKNDDLIAPNDQDPSTDSPFPEAERAIVEILKSSVNGTFDGFHNYQYNGHLSAGRYISQPDFPDSSSARNLSWAFAMFGSLHDGSGVDAGSIAVNNYLLIKTILESGEIIYSGGEDKDELQRALQRSIRYFWGVGGGNVVSTFEASVLAPEEFTIVSPAADGVGKITDNLKIEWLGDAADIVVVSLVNIRPDVETRELEDIVLFSVAVPDAGLFLIPAFQLQNFKMISNLLEVRVHKFNYDVKSQNNQKFLLSSAVAVVTELNLVE